MPQTPAITDAIMSGDGFAYRTWARYERADPDPGPGGNERVEAIVDFLPRLRGLAGLLPESSYEELQYVLIQLLDDLIGEYENPALGPLWERLRASTPPVQLMATTWSCDDLVEEACRYVQDSVSALIREHDFHPPVAPLAVQAAQAVVGDGMLDVVTLNHDTVVERALRAEGIAFADGFIHSADSDWSWDARSLGTRGVRLLKLHGSVTWRREIQGDRRLLRIDGSESRTPSETRLDPQFELLAGTHNKILQYSRGHFADLHCRFREALTCADCLVVAGFGFRDKAINGMLIEWMTVRSHRITIVHPNPEELHEAARPAVQRAWREWEVSGRVRLIQKPAESTSWAECRA
jgi:hypothetical protein